MELKGRLKLIANKTPTCSILCDVGTDHAFIPIFLVKNSICKRAVACDIRKGPLLAAQNNIKQYGFEKSIETRLGDGLHPIYDKEVDVIIIAGMGGNMIARILYEGLEKAKNAKTLILQAMKDIENLREWLYNNGFEIFDEELIDEGEKVYNIICARWTGEKKELDQLYYHIGSKLIENKDPLLERYLNKKIKQLEKIILDMGEVEAEHRGTQKGYMDLLEGFKKIKNNLKKFRDGS